MDGTVHNITQVHFMGWPDHGVPTDKRLKEFNHLLNYFVEWNLKSADNERAIVHCSAGIGRTGTTLSLMETILNLSS